MWDIKCRVENTSLLTEGLVNDFELGKGRQLSIAQIVAEVKDRMNCRLTSMKLPIPVDRIDNIWCTVYTGENDRCLPENIRLQRYSRSCGLSTASNMVSEMTDVSEFRLNRRISALAVCESPVISVVLFF